MNGKTKIALLSILVLATFLRFWELKSTPPGLYPDEAMNGNNVVEAMHNGALKVFYTDNNGREGLFINIQGLAVKAFGSEPWALRSVSAVFGVLTVLGLFLLAREMFHPLSSRNRIALFASFFLATSFWHLNFSRIGFRAITAPFFLVWGLYFFFRFYKDVGNPRSQMLSGAIGGLFFGLGFHSYIAYRVAPALLILPLIAGWKKIRRETCFPCISLIFVLFMTMAIIPLMLYFTENPADFLGRTSQISIFSMENPVKELAINTAKTVGMFWVYGDFNWRHNFSAHPQLNIIVGIFFLIGILIAIRYLFKKSADSTERFNSLFLLFWIALMLLPVVISSEGLPHALRAIIVIPPVMILSAFGLDKILQFVKKWIEHNRRKYPKYSHQLHRINREMVLLVVVMFVSITANTYDNYFNKWARNDEVYASFDTRDWNVGRYLNTIPDEIPKYVVIKNERIDPRIVTISSQSLLFGTNTFIQEERVRKNFHYVTPSELVAEFDKKVPDKAIIVFLKQDDTAFTSSLLRKYPQLKIAVPEDFAVLFVAVPSI